MFIIGCDYHPSVQQIAWVDTESGECGELRLRHIEAAEQFYRELKKKGVSVRVGMEATGHSMVRAFIGRAQLRAVGGGDTAQIRAKRAALYSSLHRFEAGIEGILLTKILWAMRIF
jgi:hypothetical protein